MKKYEGITKYISQIEECTAGKWVIDKENVARVNIIAEIFQYRFGR